MQFLKKLFLTFIISLSFGTFAAHSQELENGIYADMETTKGNIILKLYYKRTPKTVSNFIGLAKGTKKSNKPKGTPFYDGIIFHRVIPNFMIQGGDPKGTGRGDPGYQFEDEFHKDLKHDRPGILSMANSGPNTNGSQFFITHLPTPWLDNKHSVFGSVVKGMEVVNNIVANDKIKHLKIIRIGDEAKNF
jgi:peptidyl-prolyl cis-trans isomerase A (cyclophilin A)